MEKSPLKKDVVGEPDGVSGAGVLHKAIGPQVVDVGHGLELAEPNRLAQLPCANAREIQNHALALNRTLAQRVIATPLPPVLDEVDFRLRRERSAVRIGNEALVKDLGKEQPARNRLDLLRAK